MRMQIVPAVLSCLLLAGAVSADTVQGVKGTPLAQSKAPAKTPLVLPRTEAPKMPATPPGVPVPYPNAARGKGSARVYELDREAGAVRFGDGVRGRRPPAGSARATGSYRHGGGTAGSLPVPVPGTSPRTSGLRLTPLDDVKMPPVPSTGATKKGDDQAN